MVHLRRSRAAAVSIRCLVASASRRPTEPLPAHGRLTGCACCARVLACVCRLGLWSYGFWRRTARRRARVKAGAGPQGARETRRHAFGARVRSTTQRPDLQDAPMPAFLRGAPGANPPFQGNSAPAQSPRSAAVAHCAAAWPLGQSSAQRSVRPPDARPSRGTGSKDRILAFISGARRRLCKDSHGRRDGPQSHPHCELLEQDCKGLGQGPSASGVAAA